MSALPTVPACAHRVADLAGFCADRETRVFAGLRCHGREPFNGPTSPAHIAATVATAATVAPTAAAGCPRFHKHDTVTVITPGHVPMSYRVISHKGDLLKVETPKLRGYRGTTSLTYNTATGALLDEKGAVRADVPPSTFAPYASGGAL